MRGARGHSALITAGLAVVGLVLGVATATSPIISVGLLALPALVIAAVHPRATAMALLPLTLLFDTMILRIAGAVDLRLLELVWLTVTAGVVARLVMNRPVRLGRLPRWLLALGALWIVIQLLAAGAGGQGVVSWVEVLQSCYLLIVGFIGAASIAGASEQAAGRLQAALAVTFLAAFLWSLLQMVVPAVSFPQAVASIPGGLDVQQALTKTQIAGGSVVLRRFALLNLGPVASGAFMVWVLGSALGAALSRERGTERSLAWTTLAAAALGLLLTFSRAGWLVGVAVVLVVMGSKGIGKAFWGTVLVTTSLVAVSYTPMVAARASEFTDASEGSFAVHLEMWDAARDMVASRPLVGWGPGSFRQNSVNHGYSGPTSDPHNFVLQEAAESGVLGAIAVSLVSLGVASWCFVRARGSTQLIGYAAGLLGVLVVCLTQNGFRTELTWAPYAVTLGLVLRGTVGMTDNQQERDLVTWKP